MTTSTITFKMNVGLFANAIRQAGGVRSIHEEDGFRSSTLWSVGSLRANITVKRTFLDRPWPEEGEVSIYPTTPATAEAIRAEIARLEGELARLSGEPLDLEYHDTPEGGAILEYAPAIEEYGFRHWYPTLEAAKAALLKMARDSGTMPRLDGLHVDLSPPAAQYSTTAWITRRG